jgi:predicted outer membrane repeat protein
VGSNACVAFATGPTASAGMRFTFTNNQAEGKGGAIYINNPNCTISILSSYVRDATFLNNTAQQAGGAVYVINGPSMQEYAAHASAVQTQQVDVGFLHSNFIGNKVSFTVPAIFLNRQGQ